MSWGNVTGVVTTDTHYIGLLYGKEIATASRKTKELDIQMDMPSDISISRKFTDVMDDAKRKLNVVI